MTTEDLMEKMPEDEKTESVTVNSEETRKDTQTETPENNTGNEKNEKKERYDRLIIKHGVPDKKEFIYKREQMYLMVEQMLSDAFIGKVIDYPSLTIDRLRMTTFVTGEDFLLKQLSDQEPKEEQIREWINDYVRSTIVPSEIEPMNSSVEKSLDIMGRHMVRQQEIAGEQITRLTEYIKKINELDRNSSEQDIHDLKEEHKREREEAQKRIDLLSDENFRLSMQIEENQEEEKKQAEPGWFAQRRKMKEQRHREEFIASVLGNGEFSKEQLTVINRVVSKNFSLPQLQKICDPKVKPENMELLEAYYERRMHG